MKQFTCGFVNRWIFILIAGIYPGWPGVQSTRSCPHDINAETQTCLQLYKTQMSSVHPKRLFMGVDVEVLRSTCDVLWEAVTCAKELYDNCPDQHPEIDDSMSDIYDMFRLCSYPIVYDIYAQYMTCYWRHSAYSEQCYEKFRGQAEPIAIEVEMGQSDAVGTMCSEFTKLISCVETNIQLQCSDQAAELVQFLVKPSVTNSGKCEAGSTEKSEQQVEPKPTEPTRNYEWYGNPGSSSTKPCDTTCLLLSCLFSISVLKYLLHPV